MHRRRGGEFRGGEERDPHGGRLRSPELEPLIRVYEEAPRLTPDEFDARFGDALGFEGDAAPLTDDERVIADAIRRERPP